MKLFEDYFLEVVWGIAGAGTGITALVCGAVEMARSNPDAFLFSAAAFISIGFLVGLAVAKNAKAVAEARAAAEIAKSADAKEIELRRMAYEREDAKAAEAERQKREAKLNGRIRDFKKLPPEARIAALEMYEQGHFDLKRGYTEMFNYLYQLAEYEACDGYYRFTLEDWAREMLDVNPELLTYPREMVRKAREERQREKLHTLQQRVLGCDVATFVGNQGSDAAYLLARLVEGGGTVQKEGRSLLPGEREISRWLSQSELSDGTLALHLDGEICEALKDQVDNLRRHADRLAYDEYLGAGGEPLDAIR